jgi:hypothetical protein
VKESEENQSEIKEVPEECCIKETKSDSIFLHHAGEGRLIGALTHMQGKLSDLEVDKENDHIIRNNR